MARLDIHLVELGLCRSRHQAKNLIAAGQVKVEGAIVFKASLQIKEHRVTIDASKQRFVSRGGQKLAHAIEVFDLELTDAICADIGSSTGGFTDCCLQNNAKRVYAIDVGQNQMETTLTQDSRIVVMENTNIREVQCLPEPIDFVCCDISFCSLTLILPHIYNLKPPQSVVLIKPQFEVGPQSIRKGRVKSEADRLGAIELIRDFALTLGFEVHGQCDSPITGAKKGNIETLLYLKCP